jgi:hypothetical protein
MPPRKNVCGLYGSGISASASVTAAGGSGGRSSGTGVNEGCSGGGEAATKGSPSKREKNRFDDGLTEREGTRHRTRPTGIFRAKNGLHYEGRSNPITVCRYQLVVDHGPRLYRDHPC